MEIKTLVTVENDNEVFITDVEEIDFDKMNEQNVQEIYQLLVTENQGSGVDDTAIMTGDVSTEAAYHFFKK